MKIGLITHYMPPHHGGIERVADILFQRYLQRGFEVRWVASREPVGAPEREPGLIRVPCWNGLERRLQVPVPVWGPRAWSEVLHLARWADVLHVHDCLYPGSVAAALCGPRVGTPVLLSQHVGLRDYGSAWLNRTATAAYGTLGRWVLRAATRLVFVTPAAEKLVVALLGGYPRQARSIPNGVDTARFQPGTRQEREAARARLGLPAGKPIVLFVGRLVEQKGIDLLATVIRQMTGAHFLVVGDGPLAPLLPPTDHVTWHKRIEAVEMHGCYHAADCLLLPSYGEGLPLVVQEAAACGLGIVISEGESYSKRLIEQQVCIASRRTPEAMVSHLLEVLSTKRVADLGTRACAYAAAHWSVESMIASYGALLEELHGRRRRGAEGCECGVNPLI